MNTFSDQLAHDLGLAGDRLTKSLLAYLLATDGWLDYDQLAHLLAKDHPDQQAKPGTLRAKMNALRKAVERDARLRFEDRPDGRKRSYRVTFKGSRVDHVLDLASPGESPSLEIAKSLVRDRRVPAKYLFTLPTAAAEWMHYSHGQALIKADDEAKFVTTQRFEELVVDSAQKTGGVNVISCGVGEGLGEIKLLQKISAEHPGLQINYLFVDRSEVMAFIHHVT